MRLFSSPLMPTSPGTLPGQSSTTSGSAANEITGMAKRNKDATNNWHFISRIWGTSGKVVSAPILAHDCYNHLWGRWQEQLHASPPILSGQHSYADDSHDARRHRAGLLDPH